jgi:hypothetical protein
MANSRRREGQDCAALHRYNGLVVFGLAPVHLFCFVGPGHSETGLRGLTAVPAATGGGEALLAAVEGSAARIVRAVPEPNPRRSSLAL